jgi:hypothetical protein
MRIKDHTTITAADFPPAFLVVGLIATISALIFARLSVHAGAEMANRLPPSTTDRRPE